MAKTSVPATADFPVLFDQYGRPLYDSDKHIARPAGIDLFLQTPQIEILGAWDTKAAKEASIAHDMGQFYLSARMYYAMMGWTDIADGCDKRSLALRRMQFDIVPGKGRGAKKLAKKLALHFEDVIAPGIASELFTMSLMLGLSVAQPEWAYYYEGDELFYPQVKTWHPQLLYYLMWATENRAKAAPGQLYTYCMGSESGNAATLIPIWPGTGQWLYFTLMGGDKPWFYGKMRTLWRPWISCMMALLQWLRLNDVHGLPIRGVQVPTTFRKSPEARKFYHQVERLGRDATLELPQMSDGKSAVDLKLIEAKGRSWDSFRLMLEHFGRDMQKALTGSNGGGVEAFGKSYKHAQENMDIRHETKASDAVSWERMLNEQLFVPFAVLNGYDAEAAPRIMYDVRPPVNRKEEALASMAEFKTGQEALKFAEEIEKKTGVKIPGAMLVELLETRGINLPPSLAELLRAAPAPSAGTPAAPEQDSPSAGTPQRQALHSAPSADLVRGYRFLGLGGRMQKVMLERSALLRTRGPSYEHLERQILLAA